MGAAYHRCGTCALTFLDPERWPSPDAERARYEEHDNRPDDPGYRRFLAKLADPLDARLPRGSEGLDFGCGPGPTLSGMLAACGHHVRDYDPFFLPDEDALARSYDFIACSEVIEHVHDPWSVLTRLDGLLRPGGVLGVMTGMVDDRADFANWYYVRDPTHVCFYHPDTMAWIAERFGWTLERPRWTVTLFRV
jgi:2-polyprenyl-3-methyl-5-hydroxy-6-metoxy-1,4-benzoquinol methylase